MVGKGPEGRLTGLEVPRHQPLQDDQDRLDRLNAPSHPAQHPGQFNLQAQAGAGCHQATGLLHLANDGFQFNQRAREPRRQTVR